MSTATMEIGSRALLYSSYNGVVAVVKSVEVVQGVVVV